MARGAISIFLGNRLGHNRLRRHDGGKIGHALVQPHGYIGSTRLHARKIFAAMELVDEIFEVQILACLGVEELRGVAKRAIAGLPRRAPVRAHGIVTVVARRGLRQLAPGLNLPAGRDEFKKWIRGVSAITARQLTAHHVGCAPIEIGRQRGLEGVSIHAGTHVRETTALVGVGLHGLQNNRFFRFAFVDIILARNLVEDIVVIILFAVLACFKHGNCKLHAVRIQIVEVEGFSFRVADLESDYRPAIVGNTHADDFRFKPALGRVLTARGWR